MKTLNAKSSWIRWFILTQAVLALVAVTALSGHYNSTSCIIQTPATVVYDDVDPYVPPPVYEGDITIDYMLYGMTCYEADVEYIDFALHFGSPYGEVMVEDYGVPCSTFETLVMNALPFGVYYLEMTGIDYFGYATFAFQGPVEHNAPLTSVYIDLLPAY